MSAAVCPECAPVVERLLAERDAPSMPALIEALQGIDGVIDSPGVTSALKLAIKGALASEYARGRAEAVKDAADVCRREIDPDDTRFSSPARVILANEARIQGGQS